MGLGMSRDGQKTKSNNQNRLNRGLEANLKKKKTSQGRFSKKKNSYKPTRPDQKLNRAAQLRPNY